MDGWDRMDSLRVPADTISGLVGERGCRSLHGIATMAMAGAGWSWRGEMGLE